VGDETKVLWEINILQFLMTKQIGKTRFNIIYNKDLWKINILNFLKRYIRKA